jgi:metallophosphoesterase superfamily enzyme
MRVCVIVGVRTGFCVDKEQIELGDNLSQSGSAKTESENSADVTVLFVSDTHLGFENRAGAKSGKEVSWIEEISSRTTMSLIADIALAQDVDAVIHTGDILDHEVGEVTLDAAEAALDTLSIEGIPVYCIIGSHD